MLLQPEPNHGLSTSSHVQVILSESPRHPLPVPLYSQRRLGGKLLHHLLEGFTDVGGRYRGRTSQGHLSEYADAFLRVFAVTVL